MKNCSNNESISDSFDKLNEFQLIYDCCGWKSHKEYETLYKKLKGFDNSCNQSSLPDSCCRNSTDDCFNSDKFSCFKQLNRFSNFNEIHKIIYISIVFLFILNLISIYFRLEIIVMKRRIRFHNQSFGSIKIN